MVASGIVEHLVKVLENGIASLSFEELTFVASMPDMSIGRIVGITRYSKDTRSDYDLDPGYHNEWEYEQFSCEAVRRLAADELRRQRFRR